MELSYENKSKGDDEKNRDIKYLDWVATKRFFYVITEMILLLKLNKRKVYYNFNTTFISSVQVQN